MPSEGAGGDEGLAAEGGVDDAEDGVFGVVFVGEIDAGL